MFRTIVSGQDIANLINGEDSLLLSAVKADNTEAVRFLLEQSPDLCVREALSKINLSDYTKSLIVLTNDYRFILMASQFESIVSDLLSQKKFKILREFL